MNYHRKREIANLWLLGYKEKQRERIEYILKKVSRVRTVLGFLAAFMSSYE